MIAPPPIMFGERPSSYSEKLREYVGCLNAIDTPFFEMAREKFAADQGGAGAAGAALVAGLVSNTTKVPEVERCEIFRDRVRVRRMRTAVRESSRLLDDACAEDRTSRYRRTFVTLTYRDVDGWEPQHVNQFVRTVRKWFARRGAPLRYLWVAELQERGAVHYHMLVWVPRRLSFPKPDKQGWWSHGSTNVKAVTHASSYMAKYASKTTAEQSARYPAGARMHGAGGLDVERRRHLRYWHAPLAVRDYLSGRADIRKVVGGYVDKFTGLFYSSPWHVTVTPEGRVFAWRRKPAEEQAA